jgi:hypothetical protein
MITSTSGNNSRERLAANNHALATAGAVSCGAGG